MQTDNEKYNETVQPNTAFLNELKAKLPEFFTKEGSFDLDKFRNQLKDKNVNELSEGYQLDFIGKDYARRQAGEMPTTVIVPDEKQNQGEGKNSKNLFFTGDNLEVLRHLQNNYQNKIDVIYIDPPYNTGNDGFVYPDNFEYSDDKLRDMFGLDDDQVERLKSIQGKSSHSSWLTFMYPRLFLAKKLLTEHGIIFVSIDDNEQPNLSLLMGNIFGESSYSGTFVWKRTDTPANLSKTIKQSTEYIISYCKNRGNVRFFGKNKKSISNNGLMNQTNSEHELIFPANKVDTNLEDGIYKKGSYGTKNYKITLEKDTEVNEGYFVKPVVLSGKFKWSQSNLNSEISRGTQISIKTKAFSPSYEKKEYDPEVPQSLIDKKVGVDTNENAQNYLNSLIGKKIFNNPKPTSLIKYLINFLHKDNCTVMDFFAGSSTTADAVMQLNAEDDGHRKFIMVQKPEKTYEVDKETGEAKLDKSGNRIPTKGGKAAYEAGYMTIDPISRERIRRAAKKIRKDNELTLPKDFDGSFKHYRVVKPAKQTLENIEDFDPNNTNLFTNMVDGFSSQSLEVAGDAAGEDTILTTWLAKDGYSFDTNVEEIKLGNYTAHQVENNRLYLINEGWGADQTRELLNQLGTHQLEVQSVVLFGYSFNVAELRELENGLKQLDSKVTLIKRY